MGPNFLVKKYLYLLKKLNIDTALEKKASPIRPLSSHACCGKEVPFAAAQ